MPLVPETPQARERPPWRGIVVGAVATVVFVLGLAVVARATRDSAGGVPIDPEALARVLDAGPPPPLEAAEDVEDGEADAGLDAGSLAERATVEPEPDSGPVVVPGPPVDAAAVAADVQPIVEKCLQGALRFDPSLGGPARLSLLVRAGVLAATMHDAPSPVLATCVAENARALPTLAAPPEPVTVEVHVVLDGLRGRVRVERAELVLEKTEETEETE